MSCHELCLPWGITCSYDIILDDGFDLGEIPPTEFDISLSTSQPDQGFSSHLNSGIDLVSVENTSQPSNFVSPSLDASSTQPPHDTTTQPTYIFVTAAPSSHDFDAPQFYPPITQPPISPYPYTPITKSSHTPAAPSSYHPDSSSYISTAQSSYTPVIPSYNPVNPAVPWAYSPPRDTQPPMPAIEMSTYPSPPGSYGSGPSPPAFYCTGTSSPSPDFIDMNHLTHVENQYTWYEDQPQSTAPWETPMADSLYATGAFQARL